MRQIMELNYDVYGLGLGLLKPRRSRRLPPVPFRRERQTLLAEQNELERATATRTEQLAAVGAT